MSASTSLLQVVPSDRANGRSDTEGNPPLDACRREIHGLHDFFVAWYTGQRDDFERMERAISRGFELVTPDDTELDREETLQRVRDDYARQQPSTFEIEIRDVELVERFSYPDVAMVRYEEWRRNGDRETARVCTASFRPKPDAPENVAWTNLHETWLWR